LAITQKALGPDSLDVAAIASNLALALRKLGRETEATTYEEQAATIRAKTNHQPESDALGEKGRKQP
jgi:hypothetical protein